MFLQQRLCLLIVLAWLVASAAGWAAEEPLQWHENLGRNNVVPAEDLPDRIGDDNRLWHVGLYGREFYNMITVDGERAYCGMSARNLPDRRNSRTGGLLCLDIATGEPIWQIELGGLGGYGITSVPLIDGGRIYQQVGTLCTALDRDGNVIWQTDVAQDYFRAMHGTHTTGILLGDYWYVGTGFALGSDCPNWVSNALERPWHPNIVVLDKETGELVAQDEVVVEPHQHGQWSSLSSGVVNGRRLVFWGDGFGYLHAFEAPEEFEGDGVATLKEVWSCDANPKSYRWAEDGLRRPYAAYMGNFGPRDEGPCEIIATPVFHEGLLYVTLARDKEYSPKDGARHVGAGAAVCIDPTGTGDVTDTHKVWTNTEVNRTFCTPSITDGMVIFADHAGYVNNLDIRTGETLWKEDIEACMWNYFQAVGDDKIYVMNERRGFFILEADRDGGQLFQAQVDGSNNPQAGMTDGMLIVGTKRSIDAYGGPEYIQKNAPEESVESRQIRKVGSVAEEADH